ncbi:hypothetical protein DF186_14550, partial [Enterococcus hirae]
PRDEVGLVARLVRYAEGGGRDPVQHVLDHVEQWEVAGPGGGVDRHEAVEQVEQVVEVVHGARAYCRPGRRPPRGGPVLVTTWNVNSLRGRLPHVLSWIADNGPDV